MLYKLVSPKTTWFRPIVNINTIVIKFFIYWLIDWALDFPDNSWKLF